MHASIRISDPSAGQILDATCLLNEFDNRQLLKELQKRMNATNSHYVVNLAQLRILNSVGLSFLLSLLQRAKAFGGSVTLANPSDKMLQVLAVTKLAPYFQISYTQEVTTGAFGTLRAAA